MQFKTIENKIDSYVNNENGRKLDCKFYVGKIDNGNYGFCLTVYDENVKEDNKEAGNFSAKGFTDYDDAVRTMFKVITALGYHKEK